MLEAAAEAGDTRDATLLFGARTAADLYALDALDALARRWRGAFRFVPVLSEADDDSAWQGARGLVTEHLPEHLRDGAHAYLCGPPAMVDRARDTLHAAGVAAERIHCDRFTTAADAAPAAVPSAPCRPPRPRPRRRCGTRCTT
jgi:NAD(P)H-flavin reductase